MNVALPEVDGRVITRAVSFKGAARYDAATQSAVVTYEPQAARIDFVAALARNSPRLRRLPAAKRSVAFVLANTPTPAHTPPTRASTAPSDHSANLKSWR